MLSGRWQPSAREERWISWAFGVNVLAVAVVDLVRGGGYGLSWVSACVFALGCVVGWLFLRRRPAQEHATWLSMLSCAPAVLIGGLALAYAPPPSQWPIYAILVFTVGTLIAMAALSTLGKSFAVLPGRRALVTRGPYRWLRHPAYFGELLMMAGCWLATPRWETTALILTAPWLLAWRIVQEERLLSADEGFEAYRHQAPWRLIPGLW